MCGPNSQLITTFGCHAAVCLTDDVQECLWIQEATDGEIWISLQHNIIDTAVNEWRKHLCACVPKWANILSNFTAGSWKTKQLDEVSVKLSKMWTKCALFRWSSNTALGKNEILCWFCFPQVVQ